MGVDQFTVAQSGADPEQALRAACEQAALEHGHRGYTGTIAEKRSFRIVSPVTLSLDAAEAIATKFFTDPDPGTGPLADVDDKWGPAGAVPIVYPTRDVEVVIPSYSYESGATSDEQCEALHEAALAVVRAKRLLRRGEKVSEVRRSSYRWPNSSGRYGAPVVFTDVRATVTLTKARSKMTPEAVAQQAPEGWLFFGNASC